MANADSRIFNTCVFASVTWPDIADHEVIVTSVRRGYIEPLLVVACDSTAYTHFNLIGRC